MSSTALTALAYHHNEDPTLLPLIVVKLDHSFKKDAFRELVRQVQKSLSKDDLSKGYKVVVARQDTWFNRCWFDMLSNELLLCRAKQPSKLPLKTSHDYCESSFHKITEHTCLIIILDDFEHFVNDGDKGVLGRLFQLLSDDTRKASS